MPHIHTKPGQHDMTVSAYIIRIDQPELTVLVHMHKKIGKLMQIGGHIELDETPWQSLAHELVEESGYEITELKVLQFRKKPLSVTGAIIHPAPLLVNTHNAGPGHFHSDLVYGFVSDHAPTSLPKDNESTDLRWLTLDELRQEAKYGVALADIYDVYDAIIETYLPVYFQVDARVFSLAKPTHSS